MSLLSNRVALRRLAEDKLRNLVAEYGAAGLAVPRLLSGVFGSRRRYLKWLMLEHRLSLTQRTTSLVKRCLPEILADLPALVGPPAANITLDGEEFRAIVLREPRWHGGELRKGVLLIKFTETFRFFYHRIDISRLMQSFRIVLEPSWSGYCLPEILLWASFTEPVIVQASEALDRGFLGALGTNLVPIEIGASDWVDHRVFRPLAVEKTFDVVYVANLTPIKRVNVYLRAVSEIVRRRRDFRAAIVLSSWGGNQAAFEQMMRLYRVESHLTVLMNQTQEQLNQILNQSRVSVLLSRKEGSNKTLFESMFANTPVILLRNNIGVNKDYINAQTGRLIDESELAATILQFGSPDAPVLQPRVWAMANISPERSTEKLRAKLAEHDRIDDAPLYVKVNTPEANYMDAEVARRQPRMGCVLECFLKERTAALTEQETAAQVRGLYRDERKSA